MTVRLGLLLLFLQAPLTAPRPQAKGSIEGIVVRAGTNEPVDEVRVILIPGKSSTSIALAQSPIATTTAGGKFAFKDLDAGLYKLAFECNGYVRQEYGQRTFPGNGSPIELTSAQTIQNLVVAMIPTGSVSGRIRDRDGQPLTGVPVQLMRYNHDAQGRRILRAVSARTMWTNDRGEYRIYFVTPGRYYLNAGTPQGPSGYRPTPPDVVPESYAYMYYPGVPDVTDATVIDVQPGAELTGLDWTLDRQTRYRIRGRIVDSSTGQPPPTAHVRLNYRDSTTGIDYDIEYMGGGKGSYDNGVFEFRDVMPGSYSVSAEPVAARSPGPAPATAATPGQFKGYVPVQVAASDLDGIVLVVSPGASISGRVRVEGPAAQAQGAATEQVRVSLASAASATIPGVPFTRPAPVNPEETFRLENVLPGEYRVTINSGRYYIKDARFGGADVLNYPLQFDGSDARTLDIVVSSGVAAIDGRVTGEKLEVIPAATVVLVPEQSRDRPELFKTASSDQNGRFSIANIPPGEYKLFAWEALEPYAYFDPELLRPVESSGTSVHLEESARRTIDLKIIR